MFNNVALDVFIGLVFVFLLYSLMATIIQEIIATRFAFRAKILEKAIVRMLEDGISKNSMTYVDRLNGLLHLFNLKSILKKKKVAPWFYAHPLIKYLAEDNWYSKPAYISPSNFSKVILDLLKGKENAPSQTLQSVNDSVMRGVIKKLKIGMEDKGNPAVRHLIKMNAEDRTVEESGLNENEVKLSESTAFFIQSLWKDSGADIEVFKAKLEQWFNDTMERSTGWFKKYTRIVLFVIGLSVAIIFNVDSLAIRKILTSNRTAREQMVQMAIESQSRLDPSKIFNGDSSLLDSTYKLVAADAGKANNVLGLGRPWKDTIDMYDDSIKCADYNNRFSSLEKEASEAKDEIEKLNNTLNALNQNLNDLKALKDTSKKIVDSIANLNNRLKKTEEQIKTFSASVIEYQKIKFFKDRSEYIKAKQKDKCFLYSPNQAGGWETFFGWIITALAVMLGAPFWFDLLSKLISLRGTGTKINTGDINQPAPASATASSASATTPSTTSANINTDQEAVG
ncbi:MAG: hypothetical protein JST21_02290 [Bacteroidetes bacterium]|nr:hypothetical protein [Bacteroidota bacterium]